MQMIADGRSKNMEWGWCECRNGPIRSFRQKRGGGVGRGEHSRLLLFNFIIVIYMHRGYFFMFRYFYLVF
jgi:hypothetical protein